MLKQRFNFSNTNKIINVYYNKVFDSYIILNNFSKIEKLIDVGVSEIFCNVIEKENIFTIAELERINIKY